MARRNFGEVEVAVRKGQKARIALAGVAGSGKTASSLMIAKTITNDGEVLVVDTENNSAALYGDMFDGWGFKTYNWEPPYDPRELTSGIREWSKQFDCIIIDSFSAYYNDVGGLLQIVSDAGAKGGGQYAGWKLGTPIQNALIQEILRSGAHIIVNMRAKSDTTLEVDPKTGRNKVVKHGMTAIQRENTVYEMTVAAMLDQNHVIQVEKSRCSELADRTFQAHSGTYEFATILRDWLEGAEAETATRDMIADVEDALDEAVQATAAEERSHAVIPDEEAEVLIGMFNHITDDSDRTQAKTDFANKFGNPKQLKVVDLERATKFIEDLIAVDA